MRSEESWFRIQYSVGGEDDWFNYAGTLFESEKAARATLSVMRPLHRFPGTVVEFRVTKETLVTEVVEEVAEGVVC